MTGSCRARGNEAEAQASKDLIVDMLDHMKRHPSQGGPEVMEMRRFWHPKVNWYGPAGIGTGRGIAGFRNWHQIPFLNGMPDRGKYVADIVYHFFGDGPYAAVTGWPNMIQTVSHDGWMGIAPAGKRITMCSLDFWRIEDGLIRENWVMVDLLDAYRQLGVDVFARLREFNKARVPGDVPFPVGDHERDFIVHGRATSSNVQAVMWGIAELGLEVERRDVGGRFGGNDTPEFLAMNPMGLCPAAGRR
jgi:predicted ester cyclase